MLIDLLGLPNATTLVLHRDDIRMELADQAQYGRAVPTDATKLSRVDSAIRSGLRQFYYPPAIDDYVHEWSFLHPIMTITTIAGQGDYDLPFDFGGIEGFLTFAPGFRYGRIPIRGELAIRELRAGVSSTSSGIPGMAAVRVTMRRIVMRPVHQAAFFIPDIFAGKRQLIAHTKIIDARREINVVCN